LNFNGQNRQDSLGPQRDSAIQLKVEELEQFGGQLVTKPIVGRFCVSIRFQIAASGRAGPLGLAVTAKPALGGPLFR
jgi:hypothetical protein